MTRLITLLFVSIFRLFSYKRLAVLLLALAGACVPPPKAPTDTLTLAIQERAKNPGPNTAPAATRKKAASAKSAPAPSESVAPPTDVIANVGAVQIPRDAFVSLLVRSRGVAVMEQLVGLAAAEEFAKKRGVSLADADVDFEYELSLRRLSDPLALNTSDDFDQAEAERLLDSILATRHMSRPEFMLTVRRNAYLRRALASELTITDQQLRDEFDVAYGDRLQIRHIQLGNLPDAMRVKDRLAAGEDFADLAVRYSTNATTARRGGLLDPFSVRDEQVALGMRQAAARLTTGEVSDVVRVGEWYHILKLEKTIPATQRSFESARDALQKRIEVRLTDSRMRELHEKLFTAATVQISDPLLREAYRSAHPLTAP